MEQICTDRNISESDPLAKVANNSSTLIFRTLQYNGMAAINEILNKISVRPIVSTGERREMDLGQGNLFQFQKMLLTFIFVFVCFLFSRQTLPSGLWVDS